MYYRIKIEELNNGEKRYIPQVCKLEITRGWIQTQRLVWYNLINNHGDMYVLTTDNMASVEYATEEQAMQVITDHKKWHEKKEGDKVKSVTYKLIS